MYKIKKCSILMKTQTVKVNREINDHLKFQSILVYYEVRNLKR